MWFSMGQEGEQAEKIWVEKMIFICSNVMVENIYLLIKTHQNDEDELI